MNGKLRHRFQAQAGLGGDALLVAAKAEPQVLAILESKTVLKEIVISGRLVNFVLRG